MDYGKLMELYNATFAGRLPAIREMTEARRKAVRARLAQYGAESVGEVFRNVLASPFLMGQNDRGWRADFDWIFTQRNYTRIYERRYNEQTNLTTDAAKRQSAGRLEELADAILGDFAAHHV